MTNVRMGKSLTCQLFEFDIFEQTLFITNNLNFDLTLPNWAALFSDNYPLRGVFI
jgi:hypothetical protein